MARLNPCAAQLGKAAKHGKLEPLGGAAATPEQMALSHVRAENARFAALVGALDLVLSVDTSLVQLSGSLGKTTWVMVPYSPEWRYGFAGDSMPWYPAVRIFRQSEFGAWSPVILRVAEQLRKFECGAAGKAPTA